MNATPLEKARIALLRGERGEARSIVRDLLVADPKNEQAWLLMARLVESEEQIVICLERASKLNPQNVATARALKAMVRRHPEWSTKPEKQVSRGTPSATALNHQQGKARAVPMKDADQPLRPLKASKPNDAPLQHMPAPQAPATQKARPRSVDKPLKQPVKVQPPKRYINWSLIIGGALVFMVAFLSILGPSLATGDPLKENVIIKVGDAWVKPPFSPFEVPGFPLGSDQFGRDLFSRVLFAVQPTMIMVTIVSLVRLFLGTVIGLGAGWSRGRLGRVLDTFISGALSVPVFMIALGAIAMLGAVGGNLLALAALLKAPPTIMALLKDSSSSTLDQIIPFVVGLSINGWGETARIVREQTQAVRGQLYIEAAHAMGASSLRILGQHVLRQIMSMVWMLFAFEISSTLMVTAGLGFLGYYIGGDVWIEVADFVSRRVSGTPELGQMLATSWATLTEPWPMVLTGTVIFLTVLGFNLFGDGLRVRLNPENINRTSLFAKTKRAINFWVEEKITYPLGNWLRQYWQWLTLIALLLGAVFVGGLTLYGNVNPSGQTFDEYLSVPGGHLWSGERGDPYGTRSKPASGPQEPIILWQYSDPEGMANGLAISKDGTIYLGSLQKKLLAFNPDGSLLWEAGLIEAPFGAPALGLDGAIYIGDVSGGLTAINEIGEQAWRYQPETPGKPTHGVITDEAGTIYYLLEDMQRGDTLIALNNDGTLLWSTATGTKAANTALRLSPDSDEIYVKNLAFRTENGEQLTRTLPTAEDPVLGGREQLFIGGDQQYYLQAGHNVMRWKSRNGDFSLVQRSDWNYQSVGFNQNSSFPTDVGVSNDQKIWLFYSVQYGRTSIFWIDPAGEVLGISAIPLSKNSIMGAIDGQNSAYVCGMDDERLDQPRSVCLAYPRGNAEMSWEIALPESSAEVGAVALTDGRLYAITKDGNLTVIGEASLIAEVGQTGVQATQPATQGAELPIAVKGHSSSEGDVFWTYQLPGELWGGLIPGDDGSIMVFTAQNEFLKIDEQGQLVGRISITPGPYTHPEGRFIINPISLSNGSLLIVSSDKRVYAVDRAGAVLWEIQLEADPAGMPEWRGDAVYLTDQSGYLYAFNPEGLMWQTRPEGATKAVNRPTLGPDDRLYYVVLIDRKAYVQAVNPDGSLGWKAAVKTGFFSYDLQVNGAGTLLFLRDDIFDTLNGVRLNVKPPIRVDEYIMGEDGLNYLRSGHVISQWELGSDRIEIVKSALWNYQHMGATPFMSFVTAQKVIWLYYGDTIIWLDLDGNILNTIPIDYSGLQWWDRENTRYYSCAHPEPNNILSCVMYAAGSGGPVWEITVSAVAGTQGGWITEDGLIGITSDHLLYRAKVAWPEP